MKKPIITCMVVSLVMFFAIINLVYAQERTTGATSDPALKEQEKQRSEDRRAVQSQNSKGTNSAVSTSATQEAKILSTEEFKALPEQRQEYIKSNPDQFKIEDRNASNSGTEQKTTSPIKDQSQLENPTTKSQLTSEQKDVLLQKEMDNQNLKKKEVVEIPLSRYEQYPESRKKFIQENPDKFIINKEK